MNRILYTDIGLSKLGFGGAAIGLSNYMGEYDAKADESRARAVASIRLAAASGVTYFDTAPAYGDGLSEDLMGEALSTVETPVFLATKAFLDTAHGFRASVETSLRYLRRPRIDLFQIHGTTYSAEDVDRILKNGGILDELEEMRLEGLFRLIGFSVEDMNASTYALINSGRFDAIQIAYNLLLQHPYEPTRPFGALIEAKKHGMMTITMRTATSGIFQRWVQMVNPANTFDYTPALIQFVLSSPLVDIGLVGMRSEEDVRSSVEIWQNEAGRIDVDALWHRFV